MPAATFSIEYGSNGTYVPPNPNGDFFILASDSLLTFAFHAPVTAFGIEIGATNFAQTLTAYDTSGAVVGSLVIPNQVDTLPFPFTGFYGISSTSANIAQFTVTNTYDTIVYDDLYYVNNANPGAAATPEPASLLTLGLGALGMAGYSWRRRKAAKVA